jgi:hypothetical protein
MLERACILVPALDAAPTLASVVRELRAAIPERADAIYIVDDGSRDATRAVAEELGCIVLTSGPLPGDHRGKGAAIRAGLEGARARGMTVALTVDADGQHPAAEARRVLLAAYVESALVLGVRDLVRDGAPRANRMSNAISNFFLSRFAKRPLRDTQCGLRRYPVEATLALDPRAKGYDFEAEVILRAAFAGIPIAEESIRVIYPPDRRTHFRVSRDPWRIVWTVVKTVAPRYRFARRMVAALLAFVVLPLAAHACVGVATAIPAPPCEVPQVSAAAAPEETNARVTARGWRAVRGVQLVYLAGTPEEIGAQHTALLRDRMVADERVIWDGFAELVPFAPLRTLLFDVGRVRHRHLLQNFPDARQRELAAEAATFAPDPYASKLPTFQRMVTLHALYDIALGFEHSPLLGCTAFGLGPAETADGHALFARAFDFEAAEVFDLDKVVFLVHEDGKIPFASVAWPGFVGVVTGMNAEGVAVAVQGGRAREPSSTGLPVAFSLREVLATAHDTAEAVRVLSAQPVMVSHLVFVGDAGGHFAVVERAPGVPAFVRSARSVTNHFEGPLAGDPRDARVRETTTTIARRARIDELLDAAPPKSATVSTALGLLRDHGCAAGACALGDRRAIDAFIATHGVVADLTERALWVSAGPRLSGRFVRIDPRLLLRRADGGRLDLPPTAFETLPEDPALHDGRYSEGRARAGGPLFGGSTR